MRQTLEEKNPFNSFRNNKGNELVFNHLPNFIHVTCFLSPHCFHGITGSLEGTLKLHVTHFSVCWWELISSTWGNESVFKKLGRKQFQHNRGSSDVRMTGQQGGLFLLSCVDKKDPELKTVAGICHFFQSLTKWLNHWASVPTSTPCPLIWSPWFIKELGVVEILPFLGGRDFSWLPLPREESVSKTIAFRIYYWWPLIG